MGSFWSEVLLLIILILLSGFFSASETAITAVSRLKLKRLAEQKVRGVRALQFLKENPARMLSTILIGNNLVNILASVLAASLAINLLPGRTSEGANFALGIAAFVMTFLILVFGEITPKTLAIRNAERIALTVSPPILVLEFILRPIAMVLTFVSRPFVVFLGGSPQSKGPILTEEEIKMILSVGEKEGVIEEEEKEMISSIFDFGETQVKEVMTPGPDMHCIEIKTTIPEVIDLIVAGGHSRIPVYEGNIDSIVGAVYAKDLLKPEIKNKKIKDILHGVIFIPESKKIDDLLHQMQAARTHIAIVVDEHGTTAGLVTLEDLIEEIVGEIHDEFERDDKSIEKVDKASALVDGRMSIKDVNKELEINLPERDYDTIAGFVLEQLGKLPAVGDKVTYESVKISVERVNKRRITRLKVTKIEKATGSELVGG